MSDLDQAARQLQDLTVKLLNLQEAEILGPTLAHLTERTGSDPVLRLNVIIGLLSANVAAMAKVMSQLGVALPERDAQRLDRGGEPVATQYRYWYSSGEPGVWLNERRKDADDLLESGVLIREETRALYLHPSIGDSEAGAESSLRNVQRSGWTLVPVEPTEAMTLAGIEARQKRPPNTIYGHTADFGIEQSARDRWYADEAYRAMLAAAPKVSP